LNLLRFKEATMFHWIDRHYDDVIVAIIALVTVLASLVAFLQNWADNNYSEYIRQSQVLATDALGHDMRTRQREAYDFSLYTTWNEWDWRRARAIDEIAAARYQDITEMIAPLTPLLGEDLPYFDPDTSKTDFYAYHADLNVVTTTLLLEQRTFSIETANIWNAKSDGYITILTLLAASLFLYGLSTTIKTQLRYIFAIVGTALVVLAGAWTLNLSLSPVPEIPIEAITAYAQGRGQYDGGHYPEAQLLFEEALTLYPDYGEAYAGRAEILLDEGDYEAAAADYEQAIALGANDPGIYWNLGWTYYLAGDYDASIEASRSALAQDPTLIPVMMNVATALLAKGETEAAMQEYEHGLEIAADPEAAVPTSWSRLYLRLTAYDLDNLLYALDGYTDFYQEPDLRNVADRDALREAVEAARLRLKGGLVAIEATDSPRLEPTQASISPLESGRSVDWNNELLGQGEVFSRGIQHVVIAASYSDLPEGTILSRRVIYIDPDGYIETLPTMGQDLVWSSESQGRFYHQMSSPWPGERGLKPGNYTVEYYVNGNLLQSGSFSIPDKDTVIIGPIVFAPERTSGGVPLAPAKTFPAGLYRIRGVFNFSGLPKETRIDALWYRNGQLYDQSDLVTSGWGSDTFSLSSVPPGDYRLDLYIEGQLQQSGEFQVFEVEDYIAAVGGEREDVLFLRSLGDAYADREEYVLAYAYYQRAINADPDCVECYYLWWSALYDEGRYQEAIEKLEQAITLKPRQYTYLTDLGETYYKAGDEEAALEAFRTAVPEAPAEVYNDWGNALFSEERYEESAVKYQQAIEIDPLSRVYHANLAGSYREMGEYELAAAKYQDAVEIDPDYDWAYNSWGNMLYSLGEYAEAVEKYQLAIDAAPTDPVYYANLGDAYRKLGEYSAAISAYEQAIGLDPYYAYAYNSWGNTLYSQGDYTGAAEKYQLAIEAAPDRPVYHANLGDAYRWLGEYALAATAYEQAVALDPEYAYAYNGWGNALYALGEYTAATELYKQAVALNPEDEVYASNLGGAYIKIGEYQLAAEAYAMAVSLDPDYDGAYNGWGNALYGLGEYAEAAEKYQLAIAVDPYVAVYHYNLGLAYYHQFEDELAIAEFELAVELAIQEGNESIQQAAEEMLEEMRP
jgi:tetratricopeptide (TPR) repeat protein